MSEKTLQPVEQKHVIFYDDELTAVRTSNGTVYIPIRPICRLLGINWDGQRRRIERDPVLSSEARGVVVTTTPGGKQEMTCLPLDYIAGFLFGIQANRVKPDLRDRVILYQRECYKVLATAFQEGQLSTNFDFDELLQTDTEAVQAYKVLQAMVKLARNQVLIEARLNAQDGRFDHLEDRIETLEAQFGDESRTITQDQAAQLSQAVKAIAHVLSQASSRNEYGGVYGELYRKFGITSYKLLPASQFSQAMKFLTDWYSSLTDDTVPF